MKKKPPREVPSRDNKYMGLAFWIASFSKDPNTQCGAIIISIDNRPNGLGYNGPPSKIVDSDINWDRPDKYPYMVHAERNAIDHSNGKLDGSTIYVTAPPCPDCMLDIVRNSIIRVVYFRNVSDSKSMLSNEKSWHTTKEIARLGGVRLDAFEGNLNWMRDRIEVMKQQGIFKL